MLYVYHDLEVAVQLLCSFILRYNVITWSSKGLGTYQAIYMYYDVYVTFVLKHLGVWYSCH